MKILLTGATGFIGTNFILKLHQKYEITALVRDKSQTQKISPYCKLYIDDGTIDSLLNFFKKEKFDGIVHLATHYQPTHSPSDVSAILEANINFGVRILEAMQFAPPLFFINPLTFSQYANSPSYSPASLYDASKQAFFDLISYYSIQNPSIIFTHLLLYNTYGSNDPRPKIFNLWKKYSRNQEILEMSKGEQEIDITHIDDVIFAFEILIENLMQNKIQNHSIHTLQNKRYSLKNLFDIFANVTKLKVKIQWGAKPYRKNEIMKPIGEPYLSKLPNWNPKISIKEGISLLMDTDGGGGKQ